MNLMWQLWLFILVIGGYMKSLCSILPVSTQLYVVPFELVTEGTTADGSLTYPYSSLQQALDHIERIYRFDKSFSQRTTINLYPTYHFVNTIHFTQAHSHIRLVTMNTKDTLFYDRSAIERHMHARLSIASISGGIVVTNWTQISGNTYSAVVPLPVFVTQLFINNERVVRTRVPTNYSEYLQYAAPLNDSTLARYGFQYVPGQFNYKSLVDAMVVIYHSWTESHHYIDRLIPENNTVLFTNPTNYPIEKWAIMAQRRFHIENVCEALTSNSFCFVNETKTIYLMTNGSYDPTKVQITVPINEYVLVIAGEDASKPVDDIIIDNVAIQHAAWNMSRTEETDGQAAAFLSYAAVYIANATSIIMSNVEISHTGSYAIWIKEGTTNINLFNSLITDTGAGGIRIGQINAPVLMPTSSINIISNEISYGGNVFPSGVAVISHRAVDVIIADNVIHHHRYTGISIGWQWGYDTSYTSNVLVQGNYIYNTGQHILSDQGGIYTLGVQPGTVINNNVIKNVYSYVMLAWGIYLDQGSSEIVISNNIIYNTCWGSLVQHYGANNTVINNVLARGSLIPSPPGYPPTDGDFHVELAENHTSMIFTNNIVYDTFQGSSHPAFTTPQPVIVRFNNNVYYNPYGTPLLFGKDQVSFSDWQKTGQDNDSVIADPLFTGDVNQCDFFSIQSTSPAAKLGFANITKLPKWTPGCATDGESDNHQFYHW